METKEPTIGKVKVPQYHAVTHLPWDIGNRQEGAVARKAFIRGIAWQKAHQDISEAGLAALEPEERRRRIGRQRHGGPVSEASSQ